MITKAVILIPPRPGSLVHSEYLSPLTFVGGLPIILRVLYSAQWAGISEGVVLSYGDWPEIRALLAKNPKLHGFECIEHPLPGQDAPKGQALAKMLNSPFILLSSQWMLDRKVIHELCRRDDALEGGILIEGNRPYPSGVLPPACLLDGSQHKDLVGALLRGDDIHTVSGLLRAKGHGQIQSYAPPLLIRTHTREDRKEGERELFKGLIKPSESFMSRFFERRVSLAITRRLLYTSVTPNQISIFSILLGVLSGLFFFPQPRAFHITGALLLLFSSIIDGCDGELARLRFQESKWGSWIDFLGDNLVHMTVFFCIGMGLYRQGQGPVYLALGIVGALGTLGSASMVFYRVFLKGRGRVITFATPVRVEEMEKAGGDLRRRIDFADKISNRDFIYVLIAFSILGWLRLWAWFCGVGVMFYFFNLLSLYLRMRSLPSGSEQAPASPD